MIRLRVTATRLAAPSARIAACIGDDAAGNRRAWFAPAGSATQPGAETEVPEDRLFSCRPGASAEEMLGVVRHWPAWRVTQLAQLELGSRLLVVGDDWLAPQVLAWGQVWGCLWRAACGPPDLQRFADYWIEHADAEKLHRALPQKPDAVVLLTGRADQIAPALAACRDKGTVVVAAPPAGKADLNLYPDVHRRSLRVFGCEPMARRAVNDEDLDHGFDRIASLFAAGLLPSQ